LAETLLAHEPHARIIHDPRLIWNTQHMVRAAGGVPIQSKTGHAFIKERMRREDALYGGEMSAHHYFRTFAYCDSGMIPWLLVAERLCRDGRPLSRLVAERIAAFPCSGELNFRVDDAGATLRKILGVYADQNPGIDDTDGVSVEFPDWRFNLRASNTEPLLRLNVETRGDAALMRFKTDELCKLISG
jgi:phosphomannomutase